MKKTYFSPTVEIIEIKSALSLLAGSAGLGIDSLPNANLEDVLHGSGIDADAPLMDSPTDIIEF